MMKNQVWLLDTRCLENKEVFRHWYQQMPASRREKIDAFRFDKDKRLSLGAGMLLENLIRKEGIKNAALAYGPEGKPYLAGMAGGEPFLAGEAGSKPSPSEGKCIHFNLSHSGYMAACAASDRPVGIDIEENMHFDEALSRFVFQEKEIDWIRQTAPDADAAFTALWTIKESLLKYWGTGISVDPKSIYIDQTGPLRAACPNLPARDLHFIQFTIPGYQLTVCSEYPTFQL